MGVPQHCQKVWAVRKLSRLLKRRGSFRMISRFCIGQPENEVRYGVVWLQVKRLARMFNRLWIAITHIRDVSRRVGALSRRRTDRSSQSRLMNGLVTPSRVGQMLGIP